MKDTDDVQRRMAQLGKVLEEQRKADGAERCPHRNCGVNAVENGVNIKFLVAATALRGIAFVIILIAGTWVAAIVATLGHEAARRWIGRIDAAKADYQ